jgi:hypothetical protein
MSDLSINNDAWLSMLRSHLDAESYTAGTVSQYVGVARRFLADLNKHGVAITATRPEDIDRYLQQAPWMHPFACVKERFRQFGHSKIVRPIMRVILHLACGRGADSCKRYGAA